jgi:hypothetical protein
MARKKDAPPPSAFEPDDDSEPTLDTEGMGDTEEPESEGGEV